MKILIKQNRVVLLHTNELMIKEIHRYIILFFLAFFSCLSFTFLSLSTSIFAYFKSVCITLYVYALYVAGYSLRPLLIIAWGRDRYIFVYLNIVFKMYVSKQHVGVYLFLIPLDK